ncbi:MAG: SAM-dependent methyltransferase [Pseudomonadota bacterium]
MKVERKINAHKNASVTTIAEIKPEQSIELLKALHILTVEGKLNQDSRRKLKQVYHLIQLIEPLLEASFEQTEHPSIVDHGAGKSYLGFLLYDLFLKTRNRGHIYGIETRQTLVEQSQSLAKKLSFSRMSFMHCRVEDSLHATELPERIDLVTALHACDTATDDAIDFALHKQAKFIALVPCCQAELAGMLRKHKARLSEMPWSELWRHPIHTREFGSLLTNTLRCLRLEAHGYQVSVTELVGWEHSMKNELILAKKIQGRSTRAEAARKRLEVLLESLAVEDLHPRFS